MSDGFPIRLWIERVFLHILRDLTLISKKGSDALDRGALRAI